MNFSAFGLAAVPVMMFSPAANGIPTFPGPTSQAPLLQAKTEVSMTGGAVAAAAADPDAPRLAAISDPVISRTLSDERMPTLP
jgi:hypothetical protein